MISHAHIDHEHEFLLFEHMFSNTVHEHNHTLIVWVVDTWIHEDALIKKVCTKNTVKELFQERTTGCDPHGSIPHPWPDWLMMD